MTVRLLHFPLLVLKIILMKLTLYETFSLATTSKRTRTFMKSCLSHQGFTIFYKANRSVSLRRGISEGLQDDDIEFRMVEKAKQKLVYPYQIWKLFGQDSVSVRLVRKYNTLIIVSYWEDRTDALHRMIQFFMDLVTKSQLKFYFRLGSPNDFRTAVRFIKDINVEVEYVSVEPDRRRRRAVHNELMRTALEECRDVKELEIRCNNLEQNIEITQPLTCDWIFISSARWITKEQLVELFFSCEIVHLLWKNYEDQDLTYIFEKWVAQTDSKIEYLCITGSNNFYFRKNLANIVGHLPGAYPVQKALVHDGGSSEVVEFAERKCYFIEQEDGERDALVYLRWNAINLAEEYEIGEHLDEMETATSESEGEVSDDEDPVVEELNDEDEEAVESDQDNILYGEYGEAVFEHVQEAPPRIERRNSDQGESSDEDEDSEEEDEEDNGGGEETSGSGSEGDNGDDEDSERDDASENDDDSD